MADMYRKLYRPEAGEFDRLLDYLTNGIVNGDMSATLEASRDFPAQEHGGCRLAVRVFERYGWSSGNRLSLSLTMIGCGGDIEIYAVSTGGSSGLFFKVNFWSEEGFVNRLRTLLENYEKKYGV